MGRPDLAVSPPLANGWQWGGTKLNSSVALPPPGKSAENISAKASEGKSELGSNMLSKLLPFEQSFEPSNETSEAGYQIQ